MSKQMDLSEGKMLITMPDMLKLLGVVAAIGISYAMASSRLNMIEQGFRDGQQAVLVLSQSIKTLETSLIVHKEVEKDARHDLELRLQSLEERVFGEAIAAARSRQRAASPRQPTAEEGADTVQQYRDTDL